MWVLHSIHVWLDSLRVVGLPPGGLRGRRGSLSFHVVGSLRLVVIRSVVCVCVLLFLCGPGADVNQTARPLCSCARRRRREAVAEKRCRPSHCYSKTLATRFLRLPPLLKKVRIGTEVAHARNHPHQNREHHESESQSRGIPPDGPPKGLPKVSPGKNHGGHPTDTPRDTASASTGG